MRAQKATTTNSRRYRRSFVLTTDRDTLLETRHRWDRCEDDLSPEELGEKLAEEAIKKAEERLAKKQ
jgi:hypothetical protein